MSISPDKIMALVADAVEDKKALNVVILNLQGISLIADYFVICHGNSELQVQSIATEVKKRAEEKGVHMKGMEGFDSARWVLIDLGDVIVHVFHREEREYYHIERLWSDAKVVEKV